MCVQPADARRALRTWWRRQGGHGCVPVCRPRSALRTVTWCEDKAGTGACRQQKHAALLAHNGGGQADTVVCRAYKRAALSAHGGGDEADTCVCRPQTRVVIPAHKDGPASAAASGAPSRRMAPPGRGGLFAHRPARSDYERLGAGPSLDGLGPGRGQDSRPGLSIRRPRGAISRIALPRLKFAAVRTASTRRPRPAGPDPPRKI